jgi:hypothetical protein
VLITVSRRLPGNSKSDRRPDAPRPRGPAEVTLSLRAARAHLVRPDSGVNVDNHADSGRARAAAAMEEDPRARR